MTCGIMRSMTVSPDLPSRRRSLRGRDLDGNEVELAFAVSRQLYRCPGCRGSIDVGREHIVVRRQDDSGHYHQHWHRDCALGKVLREMRDIKEIPT